MFGFSFNTAFIKNKYDVAGNGLKKSKSQNLPENMIYTRDIWKCSKAFFIFGDWVYK